MMFLSTKASGMLINHNTINIMNIAIVGTRGIPNNYGGFEQFAECLSKLLISKGHKVTVYNTHNHPYQNNSWEGVQIIHKYDPEKVIGTAGQFIYDLNCILDTRKRNFDIILQLGYTSSSIWGKLLPNKSKVVTNMDGLEWKRTKYSRKVQKFLMYAEKLGVKYSDVLVADSIAIKNYLYKKYQKDPVYIPYGSHVVESYFEDCLAEFELTPWNYQMLVARLEPENSIEIILDGFVSSPVEDYFLVIGNHMTRYGEFLKDKYSENKRIKFIGGIYDITLLNNLRYYSKLYYHGHTVGGTNPSLLEAMGSGAFICANDNQFNKYILGDDAVYFSNKEDVKEQIIGYTDKNRNNIISNNLRKVRELYNWNKIVDQYEDLFLKTLE